MANQDDPIIGFNFKLDVGDSITGYFTEVSGLGSSNEVIEHKVVNEKGLEIVMKIPGRLTWDDITLKRGVTSSMDAWNWRQQVVEGDVKGARKNGSIVMFDRNLNEVVRYNFENGWPSSYAGGEVNSEGDNVIIEEITIVHQGLVRET
jgi:phage tail-like protein